MNADTIVRIPPEIVYTNLVFEGGGVLATAYAGALKELSNKINPSTGKNVLSSVVNFAATSAGTIPAGLLACKASVDFVSEHLTTMEFKKFIDYGSKIHAVYNVLMYNGLCPGDYFCGWYGDILAELTGNRNITLKEIHDRFGGNLYLTVTNYSRRCVMYMNYQSDPDLPLVLGARMSSGYPGLLIPVLYKGELYGDGGELDNFPISVFHENGPDGDIINNNTLGLMLFSEYDATTVFPPIDGLISYATVHLNIIWNQPQKMHMDEQDWLRTIKIPVGKIKSTDFSIDQDEIQRLVDSGASAVNDYFNGVNTYKSVMQKYRKSLREVRKSLREVREVCEVRGKVHTHWLSDTGLDFNAFMGQSI